MARQGENYLQVRPHRCLGCVGTGFGKRMKGPKLDQRRRLIGDSVQEGSVRLGAVCQAMRLIPERNPLDDA